MSKPKDRPKRSPDGWKRVGYILVTAEIKKGKVSFETVSKGDLESQRHDRIVQKLAELEDLLERESISNRRSRFTRDKMPKR